jgi:hypothetical protein
VTNRVTFQWEEAVRASLNIWLVRVGVAISVDQKHGTGMDNVGSAPATHQVGYTAVFVNEDQIEYCHTRVSVYES